MKTKLLTSLLIVTVLVCTLAFAASAATVTISTPEELLTLMNEGYTMSDTFELTTDIDLSQTEGQTPIGTSGKKFTGTFDGKGYTISGINITSSTDASYPYIGLFGLAQGATIKNLTVEGTVSGASYVGGIVAWCRGATIINCTNKVNVTTSGANAGGILGYGDYNLTTGATLTISGCKNEGTVTATGTGAGGIYGCASLNGNNGKTYIQNCVNEGAVSASGRAGGILGITGTTAKTGTVIEITGCKNYGAITITTGNVVGGIMGYYMGRATSGDNIFKIHQCENYGTIAANSQTSGQGGYVGGILGAALETGNKYALDITLTELYNNGKLIRGTSQPIGAIVSYLRIPLTETVDGKQIASLTMSDWVNDCDWKGDTTSWMIYTIPDAGIVSYFGMTNIVNNAGSRIFSVDSDLSGELVVGTNNHVNFTNCISTNSTAAEKAAFVAANSDKYMMDGDNVSLRSTLTLDTKIGSAEEMALLMATPSAWDKAYTLECDIDISGIAQSPIGNSTTLFTGSFDGKNHAITGLNISVTTTGGGLFGYTKDATIQNLTVSGSVTATTSTGSRAGGLIGEAQGDLTVSGCTINVTVNAEAGAAGGVVGTVNSGVEKGTVSISNTTSTGNVTGSKYTAGFIGYALGAYDTTITLTNCKNTGNITGSDSGSATGGIVGYLIPSNAVTYTFKNCENTGAISGYNYNGGILALVGSPSAAANRSNFNFVFDGCINRGSVTTTAGNVSGGILGYYNNTKSTGDNTITIKNSVNYGAITSGSTQSGGGTYPGGIVGAIGGSSANTAYLKAVTISNCANFGAVSGKSYKGSIAGVLRPSNGTAYVLENLYSSAAAEVPAFGEFGKNSNAENLSTFSLNGIYNMGYDTNMVGTLNSNSVSRKECYAKNSTIREVYNLADNEAWVMTYDGVKLKSFKGDSVEVDYSIDSAEDIINLMNAPEAWGGGTYTLTKNISLKGKTQSPIGTGGNFKFMADFDGKGYTISDVNIDYDEQGAGLFGTVQYGSIKNLTVKGTVNGQDSRVGGLVGAVRAPFTIENVTTEVTVSSKNGAAGGIVGAYALYDRNETLTITGCTSNSTVNSNAFIGGILGYVIQGANVNVPQNLVITDCTNNGAISGTAYGNGGILGATVFSADCTLTVSGCTNNGAVEGTKYVGGIVGYIHNFYAGTAASITNSANYGDVTVLDTNCGAGILGYYHLATDSERTETTTETSTLYIAHCANYGAIAGTSDSLYLGGILGGIPSHEVDKYIVDATVTDVYNEGSISGKTAYCGAIVGLIAQLKSGSYTFNNWNDTSEKPIALLGEIKTSSPSENPPVYSLSKAYTVNGSVTPSALHGNKFNTTDVFSASSSVSDKLTLAAMDGWAMTSNGPMLSEFATADDLEVDYSIDSVEDYLIIVGKHDSWGGDFTLEADIDLGGIATTPIGNSDVAFTGTFDGKGHTISGLNIQGTEAGAGFFGVVSDDGNKTVIKDFTIKGTVTNSEHRFVGGFVGIICGETELSGLTNYTTVTSGYFGANAGRIGGIVGGFVNNNLVTGINDVDNDGDYGLTVKNCVNYGKIEAKLNTEYVYSDEYNTTPTVFVRHSQARVGGIIGSITPAYETASNKGSNTILIEGCKNYGEVKGMVAVGGIAGVAESSKATNNIKVTKCANYGNVSSVYAGGSDIWFGTWTGGIVGYANLSGYEAQYVDSFEVSYCYNEGEVSAPNAHLINSQLAQKFVDEDDIVTDGEGVEDDTTTETTTSSVENRAQVGGIVGYAYGGYGNHVVTIKACYNNGLVWANGNDVAGIVGIANSAHVYDCYNTGVVESTFIDTKAETRTYGRYVGGIIGRLAGDLNKFERNFNKGETVSTGGSGVFGVGGGYNAYPHFYSNNFYYSDLTTNDKNAAKISDSQLGDYSVFTGINESDEWIYTLYGPELKYFHTCENTEKIVTTEANCNTKEVYNETCRCLETVYVSGVIGEIAADKHAYEESAWQANAGAYEFKCKRCGTVKATAETPFVYVDAYTHVSAFVGNDKNDGTTPETAVYSLEEAVRRLSATGGKAIICDRYYLGKDGALEVNLPAYEKTVTITTNLSAEGKVVTGFATVTNGVHFNLGGPTKFENIIFNGSDTVKNSSDSGYYKIPVICANWNSVEFGEGISSFGAAYFVAGKCYHDSFKVPASRNDAAKTQELIFSKITAIDIKDASGNKLQDAVTFFNRVYLGDRVRDGALDGDITSYTVANKTISATFNRTTVVDLYAAAAISPENINAQMQNINTTINLCSDAYVRYLHTGDGNTDSQGNGTAYMDKLTVNVNDNARVYGAWAFENIRDLTVNISAEEDGRSNDYGVAARLFVTKSAGYTPTGAEKATITYGSHSFKKGVAAPAYNAMYNVNATVKDDCDWGKEILDLAGGVYVKECSFCGAKSTREMPAATELDADSYKYGISATLANELLVEYLVQMDADNVYDGYYLVIKHYADGAKTPEAETVIPHTVNKSGTKNVYRFYAPGVAAKEMSDRVVATFYAVEDGEIFVASEYERNIIDYYNMAYSAYGSATDGQAYAFMNVLNALLNYGAEAQRYFRYNEDSLANATIPADKQKITFEAEANATISVDENDVENDVYVADAFYPILEERVVMAISFNTVGEAVSNLAFKGSYTDINGNAKTVLVGGENIIVNETQVLVYVDSVAAKDLRQMIKGALYSGDTQVSDSISFSFECYAAAADTAEQNICNAILNYCDAAKALFAKSAVSE